MKLAAAAMLLCASHAFACGEVAVSGGSSGGGDACAGRSPHGFIGLDAEMSAGIARFVRGGNF